MKLYSIKARASLNGKHISGAERIVPEERVFETIRWIEKKVEKKNFDSLNIKVELIKEKPILIEKSLPIVDIKFKNHEDANLKAVKILHRITGIPTERIKELIALIHTGASPEKKNMRGAMIVNLTGKRVEKDRFRGVRTTDVDFLDREKVIKKLLEKGFTERTADALALTTKNMHHPDIIAEYCISDEPDYLTGYISTKEKYYRFTPLKEFGNKNGGRIYFIKNSTDIDELYRFLEEKPVLIKDVE
ncbi:6-carboxyhexanoate-CoA ligase [Persephonella hydrogeniphila]|uniref:6-carboxyhexanoate--CoA ligase n=1 Tax=Persephonella hydrogeniphila TaxID=198703 RepID=A0A285NK37_9AQUI|nr:6-carboxyhexanoate--CoA ligase [Persephonella hydrogeniphila]SNZ09884.1 6-carboxyhexanoate-CoA ligase [Persephonella hydrogeniphila]